MPPKPSAAATVIEIQRATAATFGVTREEILGECRKSQIVLARGIGFTFARILCKRLSFPEIGRRFGGRDHSTALHAHRRYAPLVERAIAALPDDATIYERVRKVAELLAEFPELYPYWGCVLTNKARVREKLENNR